MDNEFNVIKGLHPDDNDTESNIEELNDIEDTELIKLKLLNSIKDLLFVDYDLLDKQNSRLSKKEIFRLTIMEATDSIIDVPLYYPITSNYRVHQISLNGLGRREILELGKTIMSPEYNSYGEENNGSVGFRQRVKQFFTRNYQ